jgi:RimJ/RimL family protein N-acetyltransferase/acyl CoA:acetate/3-ketoacid CoA transferase beta subunit
VDITRAAVETADIVIAQVNPRMPRTFGSSLLHESEVDLLVEHEEALTEVPMAEPDEVHTRIAANISRLVPNGATIQVGAGRIPNAVISHLEGKSDLGVHTELFSDGLMSLVEKGVVTGRRKSLHAGKIVASLAMGTNALYEFVDGNPVLELHPSDYVNSPASIAANRSMVAINAGLEVDLTGQVCADSLGYRFYSGMGGHADFIRGAAIAPDGKPIVALPSTAKTSDGVVSRIVPSLKEGAGVLTTRGDVHYVVTEYGIAYLHGKTIRERAMALIWVAHPDFRQDLLHAAKSRRLVYAHQIVPPKRAVYPEDLETTVELRSGEEVLVRPVKHTDDEPMKDLFYAMSDQSRYLRFHTLVKEMPHRKRQLFTNIDYFQEMAIVAEFPEEDRDEFLGVARYMMDEGTNSAEVAFAVRDDWQGKGLGQLLFNTLARIAVDRGIHRFTADVLAENQAMLRVFRAGGFAMKTDREEGVIHVEIDLATVGG